MKRTLEITADGSTSLYLVDYKESYHYIYSAIQETKHIFLRNALNEFVNKEKISILEMGYGIGLNPFLNFFGK
ncbi:hypothetical protein [Bacteroidetes bacterium endosymbiont of Geopemphigus sp.]|uniref:hypothetical protein n=1 Tax=Bacteroidetes bacterium endosymbiont of Geopemphigus sp. TaxID=2047937 RepID=UPI000CD2CBD3|nr:hypothetical protein [Bacteroidetes bacterium endosymbiont of Geopemphigus sp.]